MPYINHRLFWKNVKELRENKRLSQQQVANALNMNTKNYNGYERGMVKTLSPELAESVASVLESTVEELSKGEIPEEPLVRPEIYSFWQNVRVKREKLGLSQGDMAELLGMSSQNYQAKEAGRAVKLPSDLMEKVAGILDCTVEDLKDSPSQPEKVPTVDVIESQKLDYSYPTDVIKWMNTKEGFTAIMGAYKKYLLDRINDIDKLL
jgi:transcriptional regulator with XRE-family HTH domain